MDCGVVAPMFDSITEWRGCASGAFEGGWPAREAWPAFAEGRWLLREEGERLELGDVEWFAAAHIGARQFVVASYHVGLRFGEAGTVALVGSTG